MVYKNFRLNCVLRIFILTGTIYLFFFFLLRTSYYMSTIIIGLLIFYQMYALIYFIEKTNRDLTHFLESIKHSDFTQTFVGSGFGKSFDNLRNAFTEVIEAFKKARAEKEEHFRYLQTVVQHVGVGLIAFQSDGNVELINTAAKRLLKISHLRNIKHLCKIHEDLAQKILDLHTGEKALVKLSISGEFVQLAIYTTEFRMREQVFTLISLQNIHNELEEKEMEAWQNLIRVLTHEIMNSVTPIASLAATANDLLEQTNTSNADSVEETKEDIGDALQTIARRSRGLLHFVDAYRSLTRIPRPNFQIFSIEELFSRLEKLFLAQVNEKTLEFTTVIDPESLELTADPELIEQVLINLLLNAKQAVEKREGAQIQLVGKLEAEGHVVIQVRDNGPGIRPEVQEKIFIPFFTTKPHGSGIGLSLSRQIMRLHRGTLSVHSEPNVETVFTLKF